jgi:hypothetical protein
VFAEGLVGIALGLELLDMARQRVIGVGVVQKYVTAFMRVAELSEVADVQCALLQFGHGGLWIVASEIPI